MTVDKVEFDDYASDYDGGGDGPLKRFLGDEAAFLEWKVSWLTKHLTNETKGLRLNVLDFGCGTGLALALWRKHRPQDSLFGADVSEKMLNEAVRRWPGGVVPEFRLFRSGESPFPLESFDVVVISCVMHHVPPHHRNKVLNEAFQLLKPGARLCLFEHNPRNALVRYVVRNTKIDQNAILLRAEEAVTRLQGVGCIAIETSFILFFPPKLNVFAKVEGFLAWLPYGGQYAVIGRRPVA